MEAISYKVLNLEGKEVGSIKLDPRVFGSEVNAALVQETVRWQLNRRRAGTHSTLGVSDMKGGGKKPWRQKGTGRARAGTPNSPLWVGGAQSHGPKPRDYSSRLPKRTRTQALISALSDKVANQKLIVLDDLKVQSGKTKDMAAILEKVGVGATRAMLVLNEKDAHVQRSSRNIADLNTILVDGVNVYDLLKSKYLVGTRKSIEAIQSRINKSLE